MSSKDVKKAMKLYEQKKREKKKTAEDTSGNDAPNPNGIKPTAEDSEPGVDSFETTQSGQSSENRESSANGAESSDKQAKITDSKEKMIKVDNLSTPKDIESKEDIADNVDQSTNNDKQKSSNDVKNEQLNIAKLNDLERENDVYLNDTKSRSEVIQGADIRNAPKEEDQTDSIQQLLDTISGLRQQNEDLRLQNKDLHSTVARLEGELASLKRSDLEDSLSPTYPEQDAQRQTQINRNRSSSFVEADLYSEADKINARNEQMEKWKGYQLDLRGWHRLSGIGPIVSV